MTVAIHLFRVSTTSLSLDPRQILKTFVEKKILIASGQKEVSHLNSSGGLQELDEGKTLELPDHKNIIFLKMYLSVEFENISEQVTVVF